MEFKIKELTTPDKTKLPSSFTDKREPEILTDEYVSTLNREIAYRLRESEARQMYAESNTPMYPVMGDSHINTWKLSR